MEFHEGQTLSLGTLRGQVKRTFTDPETKRLRVVLTTADGPIAVDASLFEAKVESSVLQEQ